MKDLYHRSIEIIKDHQAPSGAFIASPNFKNYAYSWFRDGAFIAYSMDVAGEYQSASRFHNWASEVINRYEGVIENSIQIIVETGQPPEKDYLHTRYTLDGIAVDDDWPNYQPDGFGTWLWALNEHKKISGATIPLSWEKSAALIIKYLKAVWSYPCSDSWEEFHDQIHTYTLASIYSGIKAYGELTGQDQGQILSQILNLINTRTTHNGHYVKYVGSNLVDANLISLAVPYGLLKLDDPALEKTINKIETDLMNGGGVHRYAEDTYFGGGEWILLTAWLGWYWAEKGDIDRAQALLVWIESQADENGYLPEQVPENLNNPEYFNIWHERWGEIANPLLWSHAKYIILRKNIARI